MKAHMKRLITTSSRRSLVTRLGLIGMAVVLAVSTMTAYVQKVLADQWDNQISSLQSQANQYQSQADQLRAQGDTLQNKLNEITASVNALQLKIQVNQAKYDQLQAQIQENEKKLNQAQDVMGTVLADLYVDSDVSSVELLASSQNIGDFVDKQEYRNSVRDQLTTLIGQVKTIKKQLEDNKAAVVKVLADLDLQKKQLVAQQADQQQLVDQTRGEEAAYQQLVNNTRNQMAAVQAQQQAYYQSLLRSSGGGNSGVVGSFSYWGWSGNVSCGGGYPYCGGQDTMIDPWNLYNRECVSYVAWAIANRFGRDVEPFHGDGNAYQWPGSAPAWSGAVRVSSPQPGDAVILPATAGFAPIGHAMLVESVNGDDILISQYNMYGTGQYSTMHIRPTGVIFLRFPHQ